MLTRSVRLLSVALSLGVVASVQAQGFGLNEIGTCAIGRGNAVTGAPCKDASLIYWNPAAATTLNGFSFYGGAAAIKVDGGFTQDSSGRFYKGSVPLALPPNLFGSYHRDRWAIGLGLYVPYGLTSQWRSDFPGRFSAQRAALQTIYIQPNFAYEFYKGWSIGGGPVFGRSHVQLNQSADLSTLRVTGQTFTFAQLGVAPGTEFARASLKGDANAAGYHVALFGKLGQNITVGARYLSELKFKYDSAEARFEQVATGLTLATGNPLGAPAGTPLDAILAPQFLSTGALSKQSVSTAIRHPWQFEAGFGFTGIERTTLSFDIVRLGYSGFDKLPIAFQGNAVSSNRTLLEEYKDSWTYRFGLEHTMHNGFNLRGGYSYVETPAPEQTVTPLLPDQNRNNYSVGVGIPLNGDKVVLDAGYTYVQTAGRRGRTGERVEGTASQTAPLASLNNGFYELKANIFALSLKINY
ncbi:MAG: outer membrane protein transport protein [Gemmatimonadaceae bacterium]